MNMNLFMDPKIDLDLIERVRKNVENYYENDKFNYTSKSEIAAFEIYLKGKN